MFAEMFNIFVSVQVELVEDKKLDNGRKFRKNQKNVIKPCCRPDLTHHQPHEHQGLTCHNSK